MFLKHLLDLGKTTQGEPGTVYYEFWPGSFMAGLWLDHSGPQMPKRQHQGRSQRSTDVLGQHCHLYPSNLSAGKRTAGPIPLSLQYGGKREWNPQPWLPELWWTRGLLYPYRSRDPILMATFLNSTFQLTTYRFFCWQDGGGNSIPMPRPTENLTP
jgi:hypothetical protein